MQKVINIETSETTDRIPEDIVPQMIKKYENHALDLIDLGNKKEALIHLKQCENLLESLSAQGGSIKKSLIISILNNITYCLIQLNDQCKAETYLDACYFNSRSSEFLKSSPSKPIPLHDFTSKLGLQYNLLLSSSCPKSFEILKQSEKFSGLCLKLTLKSASAKYKKLKSNLAQGKDSIKGKIMLLKKSIEVLEEIVNFVDNKVMKKPKMRSMLGLQNYPDWTYELDFEKYFQVKPTKCDQLVKNKCVYEEVSKDAILNKVFVYLSSLFFTGIRMRENENFQEAIKYLKYADTLGGNFFDSDSKMVKRIAKEIQNSDLLAEKKRKKVIRRNLSFVSKGKENLSSAKTKAVYTKAKEEIKRIKSCGKFRKARSESNGFFKEIHNSISFNKKKSELE